MTTKMMSKLEGGGGIPCGILTHLRQMRKMEDERFKYFHYDSKLWKAIKKYFEIDPRDNILVMKALSRDAIALDQIGAVIWHKGTGISVRLNHVFLYDPPQAEEPTLSFDVKVEFCDIYLEDSSVYRDISFLVPASLEDSFSESAFKNWLAAMKGEATAIERQKDMKNIELLKKKYPEVFKVSV